MAGLGRRTHYRKHLTDSVLFDFPEPNERERIAKVVATRGGNQFDILLAQDDAAATATTERTAHLAILPTKFHKLVWVKRNDFVIVETPNDNHEEASSDGIRYIISHILYKDQVQHLKKQELWPLLDVEFVVVEGNSTSPTANEQEEDDGIVYYDDDDLLINTNRIANLRVDDDSSDDDDSSSGGE